MFKYIAFAALFAIATAAPGFIAQPVVAKVGTFVHSVPSATSHQSITQVHNSAHIVTPVVKTLAAVVHSAPVVPIVKTVAPVVPVVRAYSAPAAHQVHHVSVVKSVVTPVVPVVHAAPVFKTVVAAPVAHIVHH